jgi:hypothetical protein
LEVSVSHVTVRRHSGSPSEAGSSTKSAEGVKVVEAICDGT